MSHRREMYIYKYRARHKYPIDTWILVFTQTNKRIITSLLSKNAIVESHLRLSLSIFHIIVRRFVSGSTWISISQDPQTQVKLWFSSASLSVCMCMCVATRHNIFGLTVFRNRRVVLRVSKNTAAIHRWLKKSIATETKAASVSHPVCRTCVGNVQLFQFMPLLFSYVSHGMHRVCLMARHFNSGKLCEHESNSFKWYDYIESQILHFLYNI